MFLAQDGNGCQRSKKGSESMVNALPCFLPRHFACCASPVSGAQDRTSACICMRPWLLRAVQCCAVVTGDALDTATHAACEAGLLHSPEAEAGEKRKFF